MPVAPAAPPEPVSELRQRILAAPPRCGDVRLVCIDGPAGSGKTTLAGQLAVALGAPVVHLDDLYQGWAQDLGSALSARVDAWLLSAWAVGLEGMHLRYDWQSECYTHWVCVPPAPVVVLEGCGSASAGIRNRASLVVWVSADRGVRLARGLARDGEHLADLWRAWQDMEDAHFAADGTAGAADVLWDATAAQQAARCAMQGPPAGSDVV